MLKIDIGDFGDVIWAKKPKKLPEVFTHDEVQDVNENLEGIYWIIGVIVKPGKSCTKKLLERYGENLVCVRYRDDVKNKRKLKTIELIIENSPWQPNSEKIPNNKLISLRIDYNEVKLRERVKTAGSKWIPNRQVWRLPYKDVLELKLTNKIVKE